MIELTDHRKRKLDRVIRLRFLLLLRLIRRTVLCSTSPIRVEGLREETEPDRIALNRISTTTEGVLIRLWDPYNNNNRVIRDNRTLGDNKDRRAVGVVSMMEGVAVGVVIRLHIIVVDHRRLHHPVKGHDR